MKIEAQFDSIEEMMGFAQVLLNGYKTEGKVPDQGTTGQPTAQVPVQQFTQPAAVPQYNTPAQQAGPAPAQQTAPAQNTPTTSPVQTSAVSYTVDNLAKAAMTLMDAGRQGELLKLLAQFGVEALPSLPQEQYGAFATALRGLGAQI